MSPPLPDCLGLTGLIKASAALPPSGLGIQRGAEELSLVHTGSRHGNPL